MCYNRRMRETVIYEDDKRKIVHYEQEPDSGEFPLAYSHMTYLKEPIPIKFTPEFQKLLDDSREAK